MLLLTRKIGETIMVGNDISITVLSIRGGQVRLGFNAPKEVPIHREEIYTKIKSEINPTHFNHRNSHNDDQQAVI